MRIAGPGRDFGDEVRSDQVHERLLVGDYRDPATDQSLEGPLLFAGRDVVEDRVGVVRVGDLGVDQGPGKVGQCVV